MSTYADMSRSSSCYDPQLDLCSPEFDAARALQSCDVTVPYPRVKPLDNLSKYEAILKATMTPAASSAAKKVPEAEYQGWFMFAESADFAD